VRDSNRVSPFIYYFREDQIIVCSLPHKSRKIDKITTSYCTRKPALDPIRERGSRLPRRSCWSGRDYIESIRFARQIAELGPAFLTPPRGRFLMFVRCLPGILSRGLFAELDAFSYFFYCVGALGDFVLPFDVGGEG